MTPIDNSNHTNSTTVKESVSHRTNSGDEIVAERTEMQEHSGMLPSPEVLQAYKELGMLPFMIEQIKSKEQHRQHMEKSLLAGDISLTKYGMVLASSVVALALGAGVALVYLGATAWGAAAIMTVAVGVVAATLWRRRDESKDREYKRKDHQRYIDTKEKRELLQSKERLLGAESPPEKTSATLPPTS